MSPPKPFFFDRKTRTSLSEITRNYPEFPRRFSVLNIDKCKRKQIKIEQEDAEPSNSIFLTFLCKFESKNDYAIKIFPKFILHFPIYVRFGVLLSKYKQLERLNKTSPADSKKLGRFFSEFKIVSFSNVCSAFTNNIFVEKVSVIAKTKDEYEYLCSVQSEYGLFVDCLLDKNMGLNFFFDQAMEIDRVMSFEKTLNEVFILTSTEIFSKIKCPGSAVQFLELFVKPFNLHGMQIGRVEKSLANDHFFMEKCDNCIRLICESVSPEEGDEIKNEMIYRVGAFDIECGWNFNQPIEEFVSPLTGHVQAITVVMDRYTRKCYEKNNIIVVYVLCNALIEEKEFSKKFWEALDQKFAQPTRSKFILLPFRDEGAMILQFFKDICHLDFLVSFNGRRFDIPFLVHRYNFLKQDLSELCKTGYNLNYVSLEKYNPLLSICSSRLASFKIKCHICKNEVKFSEKKDGNVCPKCAIQINGILPSASNKNYTNISLSQFTDIALELPLTFHKDLSLVKELSQETQDGKLETICNFHFKKKIAKVWLKEPSALIRIKGFCSLAEIESIVNIFFYGAKLVTFSLETNSNQMVQIDNFRLEKICICKEEDARPEQFLAENAQTCDLLQNFSQNLFTEKLKKYHHVYTNFCETEFEKCNSSQKFAVYFETDIDRAGFGGSGQFVSLGKTSEITIEESMIWSNVDVAVKTVIYNIYDSVLTKALEDQIMSITEIALGCIDHLPSFLLFARTPAAKGSSCFMLDLRKRQEQVMVSKHESFEQYRMFEWAKEVEIKPAVDDMGKEVEKVESDVSDYFQVDPQKVQRFSKEEMKRFFAEQRKHDENDFGFIIKMPCMSNPGEYFVDNNKLISDEHSLNICGEEEFSNLDFLKREIDKIF